MASFLYPQEGSADVTIHGRNLVKMKQFRALQKGPLGDDTTNGKITVIMKR